MTSSRLSYSPAVRSGATVQTGRLPIPGRIGDGISTICLRSKRRRSLAIGRSRESRLTSGMRASSHSRRSMTRHRSSIDSIAIPSSESALAPGFCSRRQDCGGCSTRQYVRRAVTRRQATGLARARSSASHAQTLVMFVHPRCPCTRASIAELERVVAQSGGTVKPRIVFSLPDGAIRGLGPD